MKSRNYLSVINWYAYGRNFDKWTVPFESSNSVSAMTSITSCSLGTIPKNRNIDPTSRTSTVFWPWWSKIKKASAIFLSKSLVMFTRRLFRFIQKIKLLADLLTRNVVVFFHLCRDWKMLDGSNDKTRLVAMATLCDRFSGSLCIVYA